MTEREMSHDEFLANRAAYARTQYARNPGPQRVRELAIERREEAFRRDAL